MTSYLLKQIVVMVRELAYIYSHVGYRNVMLQGM